MQMDSLCNHGMILQSILLHPVLEGEKDEKGDYTLFERNSSEIQAECSSNVESQWSWSYLRNEIGRAHV